MDNTARKLTISGNNIDISVIKSQKKDRIQSKIVTEDEFSEIYHSADAITSAKDIENMCLTLYESGNIDSLVLFVVGINIGYRPIDLLSWRWEQITDDNGNIIRRFAMPEHKTSKTAIVNLNDTVVKLLTWYKEYKMSQENFIPESFVFTISGKGKKKSYVWYDKELDLFYHQDRKHKAQGLMFCYQDKETITVSENTIIGNPRYIKLAKPIVTESVSAHFIEAAEKCGIEGHFSSYATRQTFSFWFRKTLKEDETLANVADEYFSTMLLSGYFQHSSLKITQKHYMKDQAVLFRQIVNKMNLAKDFVDCLAEKENTVQMRL